MKNVSLFILFFFVVHQAFAHLGGIAGQVKDQRTGQPLTGVVVQLSGTGKATVTNELGRFRFMHLPPATYRIEISHVGFQTSQQTVVVEDDKTTGISVVLAPGDIKLSEVTVSALKPHDVQLITNLDIKLRPVTNSQEILRMVPGLFIGQHAGGGKAEQLFLRGFDLDHGTDIRLSVDGMPVNMVSHAHGQGYADLHFVIPELVQNLNFGKGPYTTDQGNLATAGWVNFQTRKTLDQNFVKLEAGQFDTYRVVAGVNLLPVRKQTDASRLPAPSAYLAAEYQYSNSYFDNPQHFNRFNTQGRYHGHINASTQLTLTGSTFWSRWNHSGQIPDRAVESGLIGFFGSIDPSEGGQTSRTNLNAELVTQTGRNNVLKHQVYYSRYTFELFSNFTFFKNDSINGDQIRQKEARHLFGYNGSYASKFQLGSKTVSSTVGIQYRQDLTDGTELSHTLNRTETLERYKYGNINEVNAGAYVDEAISLTDRVQVIAGLRLDWFHNRYTDFLQNPVSTGKASAAIVSPKLNITYTHSPVLQLYLKSGKGFHSNDTRVVVPENGRGILPAAYGTDLGVVWKPFPKLFVNTALWYLWMAQEFIYVGDEGVVEPSGKTRRQGVDVSLRYQITKRLYADIDLNATRPRAIGEEAGRNYIPLAPTFTSTGGLSLQAGRGFSGSFRYRYLADRPANEDNSIVAKGYFVADAQVNYTRPRYQFGLSVQNIFNTRWKETQFATESRLRGEKEPVDEIHFTPGTPFFARLSWTFFW